MRPPPALLITLSGLAAVVLLGLAPDFRQELGSAVGLIGQGNLAALREYLRSFGSWAPLVSCALMQVQAVIAPLPSFPLMYANGLLFGTLWGGLLSGVSILVSAVLCFGLARLFGRPLVERLVSPAALTWTDRTFVRHGPVALFLGRLIPLTAFDLLSYAAGLTPMRLGPFCLATALGMAPAIFLSAAAGHMGIQSPWALAAGLGGIAALAALVALLRPALLRWLSGSDPELSRPT